MNKQAASSQNSRRQIILEMAEYASYALMASAGSMMIGAAGMTRAETPAVREDALAVSAVASFGMIIGVAVMDAFHKVVMNSAAMKPLTQDVMHPRKLKTYAVCAVGIPLIFYGLGLLALRQKLVDTPHLSRRRASQSVMPVTGEKRSLKPAQITFKPSSARPVIYPLVLK